MHGGITGVRVGHWTNASARTGCTVVLLPAGTLASVDVRGGAPASRELDVLDPSRTVQRCDAVLLTGGSAYGLAAADGVMRWCEERGIGVPTPAGPVPIVPALGLFDLAVGDAQVRPGAAEGYAACVAAVTGSAELGQVGAGAGATVGKWRGPHAAHPGGLVAACVEDGDLRVWALVAVNAFGEIDRDGSALLHPPTPAAGTDGTFTNTTIGVVVTNSRLDKLGCHVVAQGAHDGLARCIVPAHTRVDGDAFVAAATGEVDADLDLVRMLAVAAVERAVRTVPAPSSQG